MTLTASHGNVFQRFVANRPQTAQKLKQLKKKSEKIVRAGFRNCLRALSNLNLLTA